MTAEAFAAFRRAVLADVDLQQELLGVADPREVRALMVIRARSLGYDVVLEDVQEAAGASRRAWSERWI